MAPHRNWTLRVAMPDDADAISALLARCYGPLWVGHYPDDLLERVLPVVTRANPRLLSSGTFFVVLSPDGIAVGCGGWSHETPGTGVIVPGVGHIRHFATDADWLRQGIAGAMLSRCIADARAAGLEALIADSAFGAEDFYASFGFIAEGETAPMIGDVVLPGTQMRLLL